MPNATAHAIEIHPLVDTQTVLGLYLSLTHPLQSPLNSDGVRLCRYISDILFAPTQPCAWLTQLLRQLAQHRSASDLP